ncbi:MAG: hypothetical protein JSV36_16305 [Anaerolineae bacterium]|nr:MAG: hypothetical protein JSV36_16305 [Anaerolineae bacterium]
MTEQPRRRYAQVKRVVILIGLLALIASLVWLSPAEQTLGNVVKLIYLHGALARTGLVAFGAAGLLGLAALVAPQPSLVAWCDAAGKAALAIWIVYALSSMISTYMAWGVLVAWGEPRVVASVQVLAVGLLIVGVNGFVAHPRFTAATNLLLGALAWWLTQRAAVIRHPLNPIGESDSAAIKGFYVALLLACLLLAAFIAYWFRQRAYKIRS